MSTEETPTTQDQSVGPNDAAFIARADKAVADQAAAATPTEFQAPRSFAGKFKSAEDLEKAYVELQAKLGAPKEEAAPAEEIPASDKKPDAPTQLTTETFNNYVAEFVEKGKLAETSYEALDKLGVSRELVDSYIEGRKSAAAAQEAAIYAEVGGREQYQSVIKWASENMSAEDIQQYNEIVQLGDPKKAAFAAKSLAARYKAENSSDPARVVNGAGRATSDAGFASKGEMIAAMQDPRYQSDAAYRAQVIRRVANSAY
jgi:hypothetical protein